MYALLKHTLHDFKHTYDKHLTVELIYKLLSSFLFVPIFAFLFDKMLRVLGRGTLINSEVYKIGFSFTGWAVLIVMGLLCVLIVFTEFGTIIVIAQKKYFDRDIALVDAFYTVVRVAPKLLGFGVIPLIIFVLLLLPFIDSPVDQLVRDSFNLSILIKNNLHYSFLFAVGYVTCLWLIMYTVVRWIFTLHYILIEQKTVVEAIRCSMALTKHNKIQTLIYLLGLNLAVLLLGTSVAYIISIIPSVIGTHIISLVIYEYLTVFYSFMALLVSMISTPLNVIFLTRLFYHYKCNEEAEDHLIVYKTNRFKRIEARMIRSLRTRKSLTTLTLGVCLTGLFVINYSINDNILYVRWHTEIIAHRGDLHTAPENTISAIRAAVAKGVNAVEIDVQITKDGVVVLHHDTNLMRMAGVPYRVSDLTYEELVQYDIGKGETIPTLEAVFEDLAEDTEIKLLIEIKPDDMYVDMVSKVVALVELYEFGDRAYIQSFDNKVLQEVRKLNPELKIGQILFLKAGNLAMLDVDFYSISKQLLSKQFVKDAHKSKREVLVWTVNSERSIKEVLKHHIDGIITDYPERVQSILMLDAAD